MSIRDLISVTGCCSAICCLDVLLFALTSLNRIVRSANLDGRRLDAQNGIVFFATIWLTTNGDFKNFYLSFGCSFWCSNGWFIFRFCSVEIALSFHSQVNRPRNCSDGKWMGRTTILLTMHSDMMLVDTHDAPSTHHFGLIRSGVLGFSIDPFLSCLWFGRLVVGSLKMRRLNSKRQLAWLRRHLFS